MNTLQKHLQKIEAQWLSGLFHHNRKHFISTTLPSHNHWHHYRVWVYIKQLLGALHQEHIHYSEDEMEGLIIAAFFHDLGMHLTFKEEHGQRGADLCSLYFRQNQLFQPWCMGEVLKAIEKHDDKAYTSKHSGNNSVSKKNSAIKNNNGEFSGKATYRTGTPESQPPGRESSGMDKAGGVPDREPPGKKDTGMEKPGIDVLLAIADDMDAFGYTGILRYSEILLLRGFTTDQIPAKVLQNAASRMKHLRLSFALNRYIIEATQTRYEILRDFFASIQADNDQGHLNHNILLRIRDNLEKNTQMENLTQLIDPPNTAYLSEFKERVETELAKFPGTDPTSP